MALPPSGTGFLHRWTAVCQWDLEKPASGGEETGGGNTVGQPVRIHGAAH